MNKKTREEGNTQRAALTFGELAEMWLQTKENIVKHSTYLAYVFCLKHHLLPRYGEAVEIEEEDAQQYITEHLAKGMAKKQYATTLRPFARCCDLESVADFTHTESGGLNIHATERTIACARFRWHTTENSPHI